MNWDYNEKPVCYGYQTRLPENELGDGLVNAELEVAFANAEHDDFSGVVIDIFQEDDNQASFAWAHIHLPVEELKRLHTQIGNMIEYAEQNASL